ncbi:MAG TPA: RNA polymerase sigma factor, partial [Polyangiaceae bacterium]|nr:RNA polymerase sigma factor [Polyangiaceae bacterium]
MGAKSSTAFGNACLSVAGVGYDLTWTVQSVSMVARRPGLRLVEGSASAPASVRSDEELIEAVQRGDQHVASELYDQLLDVVDHTLYRVFGRREADHDDLMQQSFEQIVRTLSRRSYARACSLRTWASTIASHVGFNALRARRRERRIIDRTSPADLEHDAPGVDAEQAAVARSELDEVRAVLVELKPDQAETLFLHDVLGHELAEIALMTGISVSAAQSRLVRGRRELY